MSKITVSYFKDVFDENPKKYDLHKWLKNTIDPPENLKKKVLKYRMLRTQTAKTSIPCVTISAAFKGKRNLKSVSKKTNLICLDIDRFSKSKKDKCNVCIDFEKVKELFKTIPYCLYVGYSVSNDDENKDGMYAIIKLKKGTKLIKAFKFFKKKLNRIGINIDEACKDITRLRFFSFDPDAYYNPECKSFKLPKKQKRTNIPSIGAASKNDLEKVESIIEQIESKGIDITESYQDWMKLAASLQNGFGEDGRDFFHRISKFHKDYKRKKTDNKFDSCGKLNNVNLSSFFYVAGKYNIRY